MFDLYDIYDSSEISILILIIIIIILIVIIIILFIYSNNNIKSIAKDILPTSNINYEQKYKELIKEKGDVDVNQVKYSPSEFSTLLKYNPILPYSAFTWDIINNSYLDYNEQSNYDSKYFSLSNYDNIYGSYENDENDENGENNNSDNEKLQKLKKKVQKYKQKYKEKKNKNDDKNDLNTDFKNIDI